MLHIGDRQPSKTALPEINRSTPRDPGYRVTRVTADLVAARPIHLSVIDGIDTVAGGEGPWVKGMRPVHAGLLIAGMNPVTTDAVCTALMGFDPMAERYGAIRKMRQHTEAGGTTRHRNARPEPHRTHRGARQQGQDRFSQGPAARLIKLTPTDG